MSNLEAPSGYPYALRDPVPHADLNKIVAQYLKAPNFDNGSSHAPNGDLALSGSQGHGFVFADAFPFAGALDVTDGLTFDSASGGLIQFGTLVPTRFYGAVTIKSPVGGLIIENGASETVHGGLTLASDSTTSMNGPANVRGVFTIKGAGGTPGDFEVEATAAFGISTAVAVIKNGGILTVQNGAHLNWAVSAISDFMGTWTWTGANVTGDAATTITTAGTVTHNGAVIFNEHPTIGSSKVLKFDPARAWTRRAATIAATDYNSSSPYQPYVFASFDDANRPGSIFNINPITVSGTVQGVIEFAPPPDGSTMVSVTVNGIGGSIGSDLDVRPSYRVVRWQDGLDAAPDNMSDLVTDAHDGTPGNWNTKAATSIAINAHATVDSAYRYGLALVTLPQLSGSTVPYFFNAKAEGTNDRITGR